MKPRFLILLVILAAAGVWTFTRTPAEEPKDQPYVPVVEQRLISKVPLAGEEPEVAPEFDASVRVDTSTGKNRIFIEITEANGLFVSTMKVQVYHKDRERAVLEVYLDRVLPVDGTLTHFVEVVPAELAMIGGDIGASEDWSANVYWHHRARLEDPDPTWDGWGIERQQAAYQEDRRTK